MKLTTIYYLYRGDNIPLYRKNYEKKWYLHGLKWKYKNIKK